MRKEGLNVFALFLMCLASPALLRGQDAATQSPDLALQSSIQNATQPLRPPKRADFNSDIYYKNKLELSLESGYLPINIPFAFDVFVGCDYSKNPLDYTVVPIFPSLRWQMGNVSGWKFLRGNTDLTATVSATLIPRGPENHYVAVDLGFRRNFVQPKWRVAPYFEARAGAGRIDAQEPNGNAYAQGQDFTFTLMTGAGARYNFNGRYSMALGATYFHVSNAYLSEAKYDDNGINVWGPASTCASASPKSSPSNIPKDDDQRRAKPSLLTSQPWPLDATSYLSAPCPPPAWRQL